MATTFYSWEEISKNNGKNGNRVWIVIKGNVYDATDGLSQHPGGADVIEEWAGKDATKAFDNVGHSSDAKNALKGLKIGEVREEGQNNNNTVTVTTSVSTKKSQKSCLSIITCGLCGN